LSAPEWELALTVHVVIEHSSELRGAGCDSVVMIAFGGHATGAYFEGEVLPGGIDTQIISPSGDRHTLSARYMLRGQDYTGATCELYIENNGSIPPASLESGALFRTHPRLITNSEALSSWNDAMLVGEGFPTETGVEIRIYRWVG